MKTVLVQVAKTYLCLTGCEPLKALDTKDKKPITDEKIAYSFTSPFLVPIEKEDLGDNNTLWEDPKLFAHLVKSGLRQMNNNEITEVVIMVESFDLTCHEYQHIKTAQKLLNNYAVDKIKEFVGDSIDDYSVIYKDYSKIKDSADEVTAKAYAMPKALIADLTQAFADNMLTLVKVVPSEIAMLYAAEKSVYSFDKTVALVSMDYNAVRVMIAKNGVPLYCHDFVSPIEDIIHIIEQDRELGTDAALDYLRTVGYGFQNELNTATAERKIEEIEDNVIEEIVRNIKLVLMSLNISIDQIYLSDFVAYIPHIRNYFVGFGLTTEISVISDSFNSSITVPEPSIQARDDFYKSGSYFIMNDLMNSGNQYQDNLIYGLKATVAKNVDAGKKLAVVGSCVLAGLMVVIGGAFGFFTIREMIDTSTMADPKYDYAKELITKQETITNNIANQESDAALLPRTNLYTENIINELNTQVVKKVAKFDYYSLSHTINSSGLEEFQVPISGVVTTFKNFIDLQNDIKKDGYFVMDPAFSVSESTDINGYTFSTNLRITQNSENSADAQATE